MKAKQSFSFYSQSFGMLMALFIAIQVIALWTVIPCRAEETTPVLRSTDFKSGFKGGITSVDLPKKNEKRNPEIQALHFYYKVDADAYYYDLKTRWELAHPEIAPISKLQTFAWQAFERATVEKPLHEWLYQGGSHPWVFYPKIQLFNPADLSAYLNLKIKLSIRAKMGLLQSDPITRVTDYDQLRQSAQWQSLPQYEATLTVPAIAPGEMMLLSGPAIELYGLLSDFPNRWPVELEVKAILDKRVYVSHLTLLPDHFN